MKKVAWVVGHTEDNQGACSPHNISCEWELMFGVATELSVNRGVGDIFLYDTYKHGYTSMVTRNAKQVNQGNYDLILELHYNAASPAAHGSEALYHHKDTEDWNEVAIGNKFLKGMEELGFRNRGLKHLASSKDRGYAAVYHPKGDCLILEPFFGTNKEDVERFVDNYWKFIDLLESLTE